MNVCIIGYSGHAHVAIDILLSNNFNVIAYCDNLKKDFNPYNLNYWGSESEIDYDSTRDLNFFIGIGDNQIRKRLFYFINKKANLISAIHPKSIVSDQATIGLCTLIVGGAVINSFSKIGNGVILNSNCVVDHGSEINNFSHICPGAIICGNVKIGESTLIGAGAVIKEGIVIGSNVTIGAGSVVLTNVPDNTTYVGVPAKKIK